MKSFNLCKDCWANPLPEYERMDGNNIWPCQCYYTKVDQSNKTAGKRKADHQEALQRLQKKGKDPISPIK